MKVFFTLLLLSNIVFAVFQWLVPYEQLVPRARTPEVAEKLRLLDEPETGSEQLIEPEQDTPVAVSQRNASISAPLCYTLGPFKEQQLAQETASQFKQQSIPITSRSSVEKEYMGLMVYIDGHDNRAAAIATAESLKQKGIKDYIIVNEPGKFNILSLGVFALKKNADGLKVRVEKLGFQVQSEPRYRNRTIYWLDYSKPENDRLTPLVDELKSKHGISRISRQCG
jgi:cell division septation protein DedD